MWARHAGRRVALTLLPFGDPKWSSNGCPTVFTASNALLK